MLEKLTQYTESIIKTEKFRSWFTQMKIFKMNSLPKMAVITALMAIGILQANATTYQFTDLGQARAVAINNSGQIVGGIDSINGYELATIWNTSGKTVSMSIIGNGFAKGINNNGQIVGNSNGYVTLWTPSATGMQRVTLGEGYATNINDRGQISGTSYARTWTAEGFAAIWNLNGNTITGVANLQPGFDGFTTAINNKGDAIGYFQYQSRPRSAFWPFNQESLSFSREAIFSDINDNDRIIGTSEGIATIWTIAAGHSTKTSLGEGNVNSINDRDQIVGSAFDSNSQQYATMWIPNHQGFQLINLNSYLNIQEINDGWILKNAIDINDDGSIIGEAYNNKTGTLHSFLLSANNSPSPIPEPRTLIMILCGLTLIYARFAFNRSNESTTHLSA